MARAWNVEEALEVGHEPNSTLLQNPCFSHQQQYLFMAFRILFIQEILKNPFQDY